MSRGSSVWEFFDISAADNSRACCKICKVVVSRGNSALGSKSYNTSNLRKHLQHVHKQQWEKVLHDEKTKSTSSPARPALQGQMTLEKSYEVKKPWEFDDVCFLRQWLQVSVSVSEKSKSIGIGGIGRLLVSFVHYFKYLLTSRHWSSGIHIISHSSRSWILVTYLFFVSSVLVTNY